LSCVRKIGRRDNSPVDPVHSQKVADYRPKTVGREFASEEDRDHLIFATHAQPSHAVHTCED